MQHQETEGTGTAQRQVSGDVAEYQRTLHRALRVGAQAGATDPAHLILVARARELREAAVMYGARP